VKADSLFLFEEGGIIRGDRTIKRLALVSGVMILQIVQRLLLGR
jgi:hypothetical protein